MKYLALLFFSLFVILSCSPTPESTKPNIIFIMADDMGYSDAGCYGQEVIQTPHIDRLASEGLRFTQVYSGASVCAPARSVLMTGLHTGHTRVRGNSGIGGVVGLAGVEGRIPLEKEDVTIAELLQDAGYVTCMVGKWGLGDPGTPGVPNKKGFDEFYGFLNQRRAHTYYPDYIWKDSTRIDLPGNNGGEKTTYTHELFADYALDFIARNQEEALFLSLPLCIPHDKYEAPDQGIYTNRDWSEDAKTYAGMITRMDHTIGRVMEALKKYDLDDNTYVFFTSDNGVASSSNEWGVFNSGGPLRGVKRDPYEGGIRVPMVVRNSQRIKAGGTSELVWYFADVMPTLADIANISVPEKTDGISVLPTLLGEAQDFGERPLYWEFYEMEGWRALRFGEWKAVQHNMHHPVPQPIEIYNIRQDIGETTDLAQDHPEIVAMAEQLFKKAHTPSANFKWGHRMDSLLDK